MLVFFLLASAACNAIDGADSYRRSDGGDAAPSVCTQACLDTSGTCLSDCASALASCTSACNPPNQGCLNKCNSTNSTCTTACVSTCTACGCSQSDCSNPPPPDAGAD